MSSILNRIKVDVYHHPGSGHANQDRWMLQPLGELLRVAVVDGVTPWRSLQRVGDAAQWAAATCVKHLLLPGDLAGRLADANDEAHDPSVAPSRRQAMAAVAATDLHVDGGQLVGYCVVAADCEVWMASEGLELVAGGDFLYPAIREQLRQRHDCWRRLPLDARLSEEAELLEDPGTQLRHAVGRYPAPEFSVERLQAASIVLAVDLDGVCADYLTSIRPYMAAMGRTDAFELPEPDSWDLVDAGWFDSAEEYVRTHRYAVERAFFRTMEEIEGMSDALWQLSDAEIHIRIVTHRFLTHGDQDRAAGDTIAWLQRRRDDGRVRVPHRDLCFLGSKADAWADMHLDDAPHQIESLRASGQTVLVFDQLYNRHLDGPRAQGWSGVVEHVLAAQERWASTHS